MQVMNPSDPDTAAFYDAYYKLSRRLFDTDKVRRFRLEGGQILIVASHAFFTGAKQSTTPDIDIYKMHISSTIMSATCLLYLRGRMTEVSFTQMKDGTQADYEFLEH